jgi:GT2 family glycosyltransferase
MLLSIIIVNYQVPHFLELCLASVSKATSGLETEVFVVDNNSGDGSLEYLRPRYPHVRFIVNTKNKGFARANNQALEQATGKYILFLNPDTVLPEDIARICIGFFETNPKAGGLGVRMIDGSGRFLKESRRGFPSPWVAFCKLAGLSVLFPRSRWLSGYYLGHLPPENTHPAPVLSGACLWASRAALEKTGGFDEQFFMYAEDIDLSYRLEKAGYVNYYLAETAIIHFKGESTRKDARYIKLFYKAMSQFRRKHFRRGIPVLFNGLMETAIWFRAGLRFLRPAKKQPGENKRDLGSRPVVKTWLTGDPAGIREVMTAALPGRSMVEARQEADEIIFCEGPLFSFKDSIKALESAVLYLNGSQAKFHALGSGSVVGSAHKDGQGEVLVL